jgi:predicted esterase YcpF (UPF0227 family)
MKIAYLHGLESNNISQKNDWLKTFSKLYDPLIDYKEDQIYLKLKLEIAKFEPDVVIGSSMGGYFAFEIAKELNVTAILFNPALHSRSYQPDISGFEKGNYNPKMYFVLGENDAVINPAKTLEIISNDDYVTLIFNHAHNTPYEVFKSVIAEILKIK